MKKFLFLAMALAIVACSKDPENSGDDNQPKEVQCNLKGYAQKGQFVKGSQVTAFAVGTDMVATGESFPANISDDLGSFSIKGKTEAPYLELRAEGYYFNEITGEVSSNPLYLEAFVKSDDTAANINLMTTAIRPRVKKLISGGKSYSDAVSQAQKELLDALGFSGTAKNFDDMDITGTTDADGMLLAFACLIQHNRNASEVTTLIQELASELEADGSISNNTLTDVKKSFGDIDVVSVIQNMAAYYKEKSLSVSTVPTFYKYLYDDVDLDFFIPGNQLTDISPSVPSPDAIGGGTTVLATIEFKVEADSEDVTIQKKHILGPAYRITWNIPANSESTDKVTTITFKSESGKVLHETSYTQGADVQYLYIRTETNTKSVALNDFPVGTVVSVNGETYTIEDLTINLGGYPQTLPLVKVPKVDEYIVSYPAGAVLSGGHIARVKTTIATEVGQDVPMYYYGALKKDPAFPIGNPAPVYPYPVFAVFSATVSDENANNWSYFEMETNTEEEFIAGTASYVFKESEKALYSDLDPDIHFENGSRKIRVNNTTGDRSIQFVMFPQTLGGGFKATLYDNKGTVLATKNSSSSKQIQTGYMYNLGAF